MDGELYTHNNVWFGAREPEWWEDEEELEEKILPEKNLKKKPIRIFRHDF